ncbi:MAG TPA: hypothetical protein EYQ08_02775 [Planctomycetes bacterium]|nr:hypothetical protein [Planctomycetota bacterium]
MTIFKLPKAILVTLVCVASLGVVHADNCFTVTGGGQSVQGLGSATFGVEMTNDQEVEGFVVAISYDNSAVAITDLSIVGTVTESSGAELVVPEILGSGFTLGVVLDAAAPFGGQTIAVGSNQSIANFTAQSVVVLSQGDPVVTTGFDFVDGAFNSPALDNIMVQNGQAVGANNGLCLNGATTAMSIGAPPPATLTIEDTTADANGNGSVRVLLENSGETQGFVLSITHVETEIALGSIDLSGSATDAAGAEFTAINTYSNGGTVGVVLDFVAPFDGQTIAAGVDTHIANFNYSDTVEIYIEGDPIPADQVANLTFDDGAFGTPPLNNIVVSGGLSIVPDVVNGAFTTPPSAVPSEDTVLWMETDFPDSMGYAGETGALCFYYADPTDNIQGMTMTACFNCDATVDPLWSWGGSIVEAVGVEYLAVQTDNSDTDGDGCELVVAILLDALPPFDGQTLPQTGVLDRLLIGCLPVTISETAACEDILEFNWCNDINGTGSVNLYNNVVINFQSIQEYERDDTVIVVKSAKSFKRGDCNDDDKTDLADAAAMLANQFGSYDVNCSDACDTNDDGLLNMADPVFLLNWLFNFGDVPAGPGPFDEGEDPTGDSLPDCDGGDTNCG